VLDYLPVIKFCCPALLGKNPSFVAGGSGTGDIPSGIPNPHNPKWQQLLFALSQVVFLKCLLRQEVPWTRRKVRRKKLQRKLLICVWKTMIKSKMKK